MQRLVSLAVTLGMLLLVWPPAMPAVAEPRLVLQQGRDGYEGTTDAYIDHATNMENVNFGHREVMMVHGGGVRCALLRFDLSTLPPMEDIYRAQIELYVEWKKNSFPEKISVHRVLRPWDESQATWQVAARGQPWGIAGCDDPFTDRATKATDTRTVSRARRWEVFDVTPLVREWVKDPERNYGVVLKGVSEDNPAEYSFLTAQSGRTELRPILRISYRESAEPTLALTQTVAPTVEPPTSTPTSTSSPTTTTAPPTTTATRTLTPTAVPTHTPTRTATARPINTRVPTSTALPTSTHTATTNPTRTRAPTSTAVPASTPTHAFIPDTPHLVCLPLVRHGAQVPLHDIYEPNDRVDQAWRTLQPSGRYTAYLYDGDPDDWYCLDLAAGQHVVINLAMPPEVDFDLYLYRDAPLVLVSRSDATGNGVGEHIAYTATQAAHCYVRVHPYRGTSFKRYTLQLGS